MKRSTLITIILFSSLILDQITKIIARNTLANQYFSFWGDTIRLTLAENSGAFLSLGSTLSDTARFLIFTVGIGLLMVGGVVLLYRKSNLDRLVSIAYSLILSGGIGNLIDRGMKATVTDFMNVGIGPVRTGVFNIADMAIMAGVGILLVQNFKESKSSR